MALSGDARMGLVYDGSDVNLTSRARVTFTLSGETDHGLAFGGSFRADNASGAAAGSAGNVFIEGAFGKLSFGDVDGAALAATGDLHGVGLTGLGDTNEMTYISRVTNGLDAFVTSQTNDLFEDEDDVTVTGITTGLSSFPRALYTYSIDGFSVYASVAVSNSSSIGFAGTITEEVDDTDVDVPFSGSVAVDSSLVEAAIGASYEIDGFMVAAGYEQARLKVDGESETFGHGTLALGYSIEGVEIKAIYGRAMNDLRGVFASNDQYGVSVSGSFDAVTVTAFGREDFARTQYLGLGASYDLGGGAALRGGVVNTNPRGASSNTTADFGLAFTF